MERHKTFTELKKQAQSMKPGEEEHEQELYLLINIKLFVLLCLRYTKLFYYYFSPKRLIMFVWMYEFILGENNFIAMILSVTNQSNSLERKI